MGIWDIRLVKVCILTRFGCLNMGVASDQVFIIIIIRVRLSRKVLCWVL